MNRERHNKSETCTALKSGGGSLAVGTCLQRGSAHSQPLLPSPLPSPGCVITSQDCTIFSRSTIKRYQLNHLLLVFNKKYRNKSNKNIKICPGPILEMSIAVSLSCSRRELALETRRRTMPDGETSRPGEIPSSILSIPHLAP